MKHQRTQSLQKEKPLNRTQRLAGKLGIVLCSVLLECTTYGQPSVSVGVEIVLPSVEIRAESDFYEPLTPHGEWVMAGSHGRVWRPGHVARDWRPYSNGHWVRTDAGWYWVSEEPWAWATYHYGRWDYTEQYGWYWVPQTQWAPAWVSWHEGGGYVGWAPLQPSVSISVGGYVGFNPSRIPPRAYVFVEQRQFLEPIRSTTVVVSSPTIISKTVVITNTKIVNNTVINEGPATTVIEKASGKKVQAVPVRELRQKSEAPVTGKLRPAAAAGEKKAKAPVRSETAPAEKKQAVTPAPSQPSTPPPAAKNPPPMKEPKETAKPKAEKQEKPGKPPDRETPPSPKQKPGTDEKGKGNSDKDREKKPKE
jgi:hypothetical protein